MAQRRAVKHYSDLPLFSARGILLGSISVWGALKRTTPELCGVSATGTLPGSERAFGTLQPQGRERPHTVQEPGQLLSVVYLRALTPGPMWCFVALLPLGWLTVSPAALCFSVQQCITVPRGCCWCLASPSSSLVPLSGGCEVGSFAGCFLSSGATRKPKERGLVLLDR